MSETWRPVVGAEVWYEVSDRGRVRSRHTIGRPAKRGILASTTTRKGYLRVGISGGGLVRGRLIHRLVLDAFYGPPPSCLHQCNHKDGNKANNHTTNLDWVTPKENAAHAKRTGLWHPHIGVSHGRAKLTEQQVHTIRRRRGKDSAAVLGSRYGVSGSAIRLIWKGINWKHLAQEAPR